MFFLPFSLQRQRVRKTIILYYRPSLSAFNNNSAALSAVDCRSSSDGFDQCDLVLLIHPRLLRSVFVNDTTPLVLAFCILP